MITNLIIFLIFVFLIILISLLMIKERENKIMENQHISQSFAETCYEWSKLDDLNNIEKDKLMRIYNMWYNGRVNKPQYDCRIVSIASSVSLVIAQIIFNYEEWQRPSIVLLLSLILIGFALIAGITVGDIVGEHLEFKMKDNKKGVKYWSTIVLYILAVPVAFISLLLFDDLLGLFIPWIH